MLTTKRSISSATLGRPALAKFRSIKLFSEELPIPAQNCIGLGCSGHFLQGLSSQPVAISANVAFSSCESNSRPLIWAFRMRFSAARYSSYEIPSGGLSEWLQRHFVAQTFQSFD